MSELCNNCPMQASMDVAEEALAKAPKRHAIESEANERIKDIQLLRDIARKVIESVDCTGPTVENKAYVVCPNKKTVEDAVQYFKGEVLSQ